MNLLESVRIAYRALAANKVRSLLTMLGVIIGVAAVILLVAVGSGVRNEITGTIEGLGSNLLFVFPGQYDMGGGGGGSGPGGPAASVTKSFRLEDVSYLRGKLASRAIVVPVVQAPVRVRGNGTEFRSTMAGSNELGPEVFTADYAGGRHYNKSEYTSAARVAVIGDTVREKLFPGQNPIGRKILINGETFTVIGFMKPQGGSFSGDQDNQIYAPATTAQRLIGADQLSMIVVKSNDSKDIELVKALTQQALRPKFGQDFTVFTQEQTLGILSTVLGTLTLMLAGIASISLLVGGIGIMNIMLVSVSERTREIGIRKAVGARTHDIMSQFVIEAVFLSVLGGMVGILIGWLGALAIGQVVPTQVTAWAVALAFFFSAAVGIFFGVYPAWKASRLDPIVALRYE